ncbi:MAG: DNA internalization-related competence protein ComEC/Rec2 [Pseudomonadota bacterium]
MRTAALLVLLITAGLFLLPAPLPLAVVGLAVPAVALLFCRNWPSRWLGVALLTLALSTAHFHWRFNWQLPEADIQQDVEVVGRIVSLPEVGDRSVRFLFVLERYRDITLTRWQPATVRLSWYEPTQQPQVGERWRFTLRLKPPRGSVNFQGFDYERWLFAHHVQATGYVRERPPPERMAEASRTALASWRQSMRDQLLTLPLQHGAVIAGLSFGADDAISPQDWRLLRDTGTTHLVAISGLHITLIALVAGVLASAVWRLVPRLPLFWPAPLVGIVVGLAAALFYSALAGFATPTLRAVLMLAVVALGWLWRRQFAVSSTLALALVLTLWLDPCAVLEPGFWLSFGAVALLFLLGTARPISRPWWWTAIRVQLLLSLALLPMTLLWFGQASLVAPLANLLAVPWVSFVSTPLALLGCFLLSWSPALADLLLRLCDGSLALFFVWLHTLAEWPLASWQPAQLSWPATVMLVLAAVLAVAPWMPWRRLLPLLLLAPVLEWSFPVRPEARLTLLDVGQGTALIVEAGDAVMVYDAGPRGERFDAGEMIVVPALRAAGWRALDLLWLSHADNDHAGGARAVLAGLPVRRVLAGEPVAEVPAMPCQQGMAMTLAAANLTVLHPAAGTPERKSNDRSCVLLIQLAGQRILLAGDISAEIEARLLLPDPAAVQADIVLVPHHGSRSSSSAAFVAAVAPRWALISAGYRNPHRHPRPEVVERYRAAGAQILNTAEQGAVTLTWSAGEPVVVELARRPVRLWRRSLPTP